jgi:hypothetical protein
VHFFFLFLALFILHIPVMALYCSYEFYDGALTTLTLGNMGFSEPVCTIEALQAANTNSEDASQMSVQCPDGSTIKGLKEFGITTMFEDQRSCARSRATGTQYCDQFMHNENFEAFF